LQRADRDNELEGQMTLASVMLANCSLLPHSRVLLAVSLM
jgi:hypothetical protein